jgi:protein-arginine kinase
MDIHDFLVPPAETARRKGPHDRIVMSSRVRLARNIKDAAFPDGPRSLSEFEFWN